VSTITISVNPIAGRGLAVAMAQELHDRLQSGGDRAVVFSDAPDQIPADAVAESDILIVVGGDGTLRAVLGRFLQFRNPPPPVLPVPLGTANLMAKTLGIDWTRAQLMDGILASLRKPRIRLLDAAGANGELFLLMAGIGIDAMIVHDLHRQRTGPIHRGYYLLPAARALAEYPFTPLTVRVDEKLLLESTPAMVFIANISQHGVGFPILPDAIPDDGLLDVCVIPMRSTLQTIDRFLAAAAGELLAGENVLNVRGRDIQIESAAPVPVQLDGDPGGYTPVRIKLLPMRLPFILPAEMRRD
jgi:diacylglycerol kinase family enzyme